MARPFTSSPLSTAPSSQVILRAAASEPISSYRKAADLPHELLQHLQIYIEETLFTQCLKFSTSLITSSIASQGPIFIPPPQYLSVIATLAIHPSLTTRTTEREKREQSIHALKLLTLINRTVGPLNSRVTEAYRFRRFDSRIGDSDSEDSDIVRTQRLISRYAESDNLFSLAEDFWSVVGWTLNCASKGGLYNERWFYWCPWLEHMVNVLETDWAAHYERGTQAESLIWHYANQASGRNARARRMLRSIFADGSNASINEFREIFSKELKGPRKEKTEPRARDVRVDVDEEIYADYMDEDESSTDEDATAAANNVGSNRARPSKRLRTRTPSTRRHLGALSSDGITRQNIDEDSDPHSPATDGTLAKNHPALLKAVAMRLRLMQLLANLSSHLMTIESPDANNLELKLEFPDMHDLNTLFIEFVRPLPLLSFLQIILPTRMAANKKRGVLTPETHTMFLLFMFSRFVEASSSSHHKYLTNPQSLTLKYLEKECLPFSSAKVTVDALARLSLCMEGLVKLYASTSTEPRNDGENYYVRKTFSLGMKRRLEEAEEARSRKAASAADDEALAVLIESQKRTAEVLAELLPTIPAPLRVPVHPDIAETLSEE